MKVLINTVIIILSHKFKMKNDKILNKTFDKTFNKIYKVNNFDKSRLFNKIIIDQEIIFLSKNKIITEKIIFILNAITQIIQLKIINFHLILIKYL